MKETFFKSLSLVVILSFLMLSFYSMSWDVENELTEKEKTERLFEEETGENEKYVVVHLLVGNLPLFTLLKFHQKAIQKTLNAKSVLLIFDRTIRFCRSQQDS